MSLGLSWPYVPNPNSSLGPRSLLKALMLLRHGQTIYLLGSLPKSRTASTLEISQLAGLTSFLVSPGAEQR
jgi:hypothetical protein